MKEKTKKEGGWVYGGKSGRKDGQFKRYVGMTRKDPKVRETQHKREVKNPNSKTWTGRGTSYKTIFKFWSKNPEKAEKTLKKKRKGKWW